MSGDSPYRRPETPAQIVTDEKVGAHIGALIDSEIDRNRRAEARRRRWRRIGGITLWVGPIAFAALVTLLFATEHETAAVWSILGAGGALVAVLLVWLIASIPARSDPPG